LISAICLPTRRLVVLELVLVLELDRGVLALKPNVKVRLSVPECHCTGLDSEDEFEDDFSIFGTANRT
jgi:hypothetical protein